MKEKYDIGMKLWWWVAILFLVILVLGTALGYFFDQLVIISGGQN